MVHQHTHLDTAAHSTFHGREDAFGLFVPAQREVFDMDELVGVVDILGDTRKDAVVFSK